MAPIKAAAKAFTHSTLDLPTDPGQAPLILVARFHGEFLLPYRKEETLARATQLEHNQAFDVLGADTYVEVEAQSPDALAQQKGALGDSIDKFTVLQALQKYDRSWSPTLSRWLATTQIPLHPGSSYGQDTQRAKASLEDLLNAGGWHMPKDLDELDNLIRALAAPALPVPVYGDFGGALAWPEPMSQEDQGRLFGIVADNQPPLPGLDSDAVLGSTDVLGALMKRIPESTKRDPVATLQAIFYSNGAENLGQELKKRMGDVAEQSSPLEMLMTALWATLDAKGLDDPKAGYVAGFDLAAQEHNRQPLSVIKQRLIEHLKKFHITTAEAAPVAAVFLLRRAAPELLVSGVPPSITYGTLAWLTFKNAVDRIEATSPGATASMSFTQIVAFDSIAPVTDQEQDIQEQSSQQGIMAWGAINGILPPEGPYTEAQLAQARRAASLQQQQMMDAVSGLTASVPTQRSIALAELKARFGEGFPFEEKSIRSHRTTTDSYKLTPSITTDPVGSYSLLDLYLSKNAGQSVGWHSSNPRITEAVIREVSALTDPIVKHEAAFDLYKGNLSQAWSAVTRSLIANLPLEDRKNIEWGQLTVYQSGISERVNVIVKNGSHWGDRNFSPKVDDRSLIIKTERNGSTTYYEFDPQHNAIRRRDDWKDSFKEGLQGSEVRTTRYLSEYFTAPEIRRLSPSDDDVSRQLGRNDGVGQPNSFSSNRSVYLGQMLSDNIIKSYRWDDIKASTREITTFDEEKAQGEFMRNLILAPIPGGTALWNLAQGNYQGALADVIFDLVMYATTAGFGNVGGAAKGISKASKPLGQSLLRSVGQGARSGASRGTSIINSAYQRIRSRVKGDFTQSGVRMNQQQARLVDARTDLFEGTAKATESGAYFQTIARYDAGKRGWYAYNPTTNTSYGKPLAEFKPVTSTNLDTKWQNLTRKAENGPQSAAFRDGYLNGDPASIPGYFSGMTSSQVKKLTVSSKKLSPKQMGILARQHERLAVQHGLNGVNMFNDTVRSAGGSVTPMPQIFYLSQTQPLSKGQCAALSHLLVEATRNGKVNTLINNFYQAAATPKAASSRKFIQTLTDLQKKVETPTGFHGVSSSQVNSVPYTKIADDLGQSPGTKILMLGDDGHAMSAGVLVDGNKRSYFFFDPNYGLASFPSIDSFRNGLTNVFNNKNFARPYKTTGPANEVLEVKMSTNDGSFLLRDDIDKSAVINAFSAPLE